MKREEIGEKQTGRRPGEQERKKAREEKMEKKKKRER